MIKTALVHDWLVSMGGAEKCLEVFCDLFPDAPLYTIVYAPETANKMGIPENKVCASSLQKIRNIQKRYRKFLPLFPYAIEQFNLDDYDVILSDSHCVAKGVLTRADQLHICYCHTPVRYAWDLTHRYLRENEMQKGLKSTLARSALHYLRIWDVQTASRVDYFIANSYYTAARIWHCYRREAKVIYPPVNIDRFNIQSKKGDYFLFFSRLVPYKKADLVIKTFNQLGLPLKVLGDGPQLDQCRKLAGPNIEIMGYQDDGVVVESMNQARALVFAAEEDFGIVPIEAQACGTPVIAYGRGGALETVVPADGSNWDTCTGMFFNQQTEASLAEKIKAFVKWENKFNPNVLRKNAERFNRERFKKEIEDFKDIKWDEFNKKHTLSL
ncbi:MAG: glycosyltransferase family 4 protein [Syntrophomonas sp.]